MGSGSLGLAAAAAAAAAAAYLLSSEERRTRAREWAVSWLGLRDSWVGKSLSQLDFVKFFDEDARLDGELSPVPFTSRWVAAERAIENERADRLFEVRFRRFRRCQ